MSLRYFTIGDAASLLMCSSGLLDLRFGTGIPLLVGYEPLSFIRKQVSLQLVILLTNQVAQAHMACRTHPYASCSPYSQLSFIAAASASILYDKLNCITVAAEVK